MPRNTKDVRRAIVGILAVLLVGVSVYAFQAVDSFWRDGHASTDRVRRATRAPRIPIGVSPEAQETPLGEGALVSASVLSGELAEALDEHEIQLVRLQAITERGASEPAALVSDDPLQVQASPDVAPRTMEVLKAAREEHERALETLSAGAEGPQAETLPVEELVRVQQATAGQPSPSQEELAAQHEHYMALEVLGAVAEQAQGVPESPAAELLQAPDDSPSPTGQNLTEALAAHEAALEEATDR